MAPSQKTNLQLLQEVQGSNFINPATMRELAKRRLSWIFNQPMTEVDFYRKIKNPNINLLGYK